MAAFDRIRFSTQRLTLRPLVKDDAEALFAIHADPRVMRYGSEAPWNSIEMAKSSINRDRDAMRYGESLRLGLERNIDGVLIGTCSLFAIVAASRRAEVAYGLAASAWG
jgi:[ribosomal protein S5]-alanine N-acetyltransferase